MRGGVGDAGSTVAMTRRETERADATRASG